MSLVLKAFPMAFLIDPNSDIKIANDRLELNTERESLNLIKVSTNLMLEDINFIMEHIDIPYKYSKENYFFENGLQLGWNVYNGHYCAYISLSNVNYFIAKNINPALYLVKEGENLCKIFDVILKKNVRDINSKEIFYYCYKTPYKLREDVLALLNKNKIENILRNSELEIRFRFNNKNYKFIRKNKRDCFYLESEQNISLVNLIKGKKPILSRVLKTNYTDKDALIKTLEEYGAERLDSDDYNVSCDLLGMRLLYSKNYSQGSYDLEINKITDENVCTKVLEDLKEEYSSNVQEMTYRKIKERIKNQNFHISNEEIEDDNSIVLTIDVG